MMLRLLLYGNRVGAFSSRKIEARTHEDVAFRFLTADEHPDHDTIADVRKRHLKTLAGLFTQALLLCEKDGLVKLGHVAVDKTKIKANASKHKA
jgi:transposase